MMTLERPASDVDRRWVMCGMPAIWISMGDGNLLLDLFGGAAGPLRDDLHVVVGDVGVSLNRQVVERDDAPSEEHDRETKDEPAIIQRKIDEPTNHYWSAVFCRARAFETTCWPTSMPEMISCMLPGKHVAAPHRYAAKCCRSLQEGRPSRDHADEAPRGRHLRMGLESFAMNCGSGKHSHTHQRVRIIDLDAYLGGADLRIEDGTNVADHASQDPVGIGSEANVRLLTEMHRGKIVLVDIADDPDVRQVGDGEGVRRTGISDASRGCSRSHSAQ